MNYIEFYNIKIRPFKKYKYWIHYSNLSLTLLFYCLYPLLLLLCIKDSRLLSLILYPGLSFLIVSFLRDKINRKRPYECGLKPILKKNTQGNSMPSRHIFSSVIISMCYVWVFPTIGVLLLILSLFEAIIRVIAGVHYPTDVIAGYICGVVTGVLMLL